MTPLLEDLRDCFRVTRSGDLVRRRAIGGPTFKGEVVRGWRVRYYGWSVDRAWTEAQQRGMHKFYLWLGWEKKFRDLFVQK